MGSGKKQKCMDGTLRHGLDIKFLRAEPRH